MDSNVRYVVATAAVLTSLAIAKAGFDAKTDKETAVALDDKREALPAGTFKGGVSLGAPCDSDFDDDDCAKGRWVQAFTDGGVELAPTCLETEAGCADGGK